MEQDIVIKQITEFSQDIADAIRRLVPVLGSEYEALSDEEFRSMLLSPANRLFVAKSEETVVGMISMIVYRIPYRSKAWAEDLVVDPNHQGKGIGKKLLEKVIEQAKEEKISSLNLTSDTRHESAHSLYEKLGFEKRDTNVFRMLL